MSNKEFDNNVELSIIVPIYNVELYLKECLDSLFVQGIERFEVIMVDDGSTDSTEAIANEYVLKDERFSLIKIENVGPGKARNMALDKINGKYLTFLDADDILVKQAYSKMIEVIESNHSQIVIGGVYRFNSENQYKSRLHSLGPNKQSFNTTFNKEVSLVYDSTAWNKIYLTSFIKDNNIRFEEGILFEDIPFVMKTFLEASSISMIEDKVYLWRSRDDGGLSITQNFNDINYFTDRLKSIEIVDALFDQYNVEINIKKAWQKKLLIHDFKLALNNYFKGDSNYQTMVYESIKTYLGKNKIYDNSLFIKFRLLYKILLESNKEVFEQYLCSMLTNKLDLKLNENIIFTNNLLNENNLEVKAQSSDFQEITSIDEITINEEDIIIKGSLEFEYLDVTDTQDINARIMLVDKNYCEIELNSYTIKFDKNNYVLTINKEELELNNYVKVKVLYEYKEFKLSAYIKRPFRSYKTLNKYFYAKNKVYYFRYDYKNELIIESYLICGTIKDIQVNHDELSIHSSSNLDNTLSLFNRTDNKRIDLVAQKDKYILNNKDAKYLQSKSSRGAYRFTSTTNNQDSAYITDIFAQPLIYGSNQMNIVNENGYAILKVSRKYALLNKINVNDNHLNFDIYMNLRNSKYNFVRNIAKQRTQVSLIVDDGLNKYNFKGSITKISDNLYNVLASINVNDIKRLDKCSFSLEYKELKDEKQVLPLVWNGNNLEQEEAILDIDGIKYQLKHNTKMYHSIELEKLKDNEGSM